MKMELEELKRVVDIENKQSENNRIKNMMDEELRQAIAEELQRLGFESDAHFYECAKNLILEKDARANVSHVFAISERIFELFEDFKIYEEFMLKYSSLELTE